MEIPKQLSKNGRRIVEQNNDNFVQRCRNRLHWTIQEQWNKIFSNEMQVVLEKNSHMYV
jgi:hypothetical protein